MKFIGPVLSGLAERLARPVRAAAAWRWGTPIARAVAAALGLVVLAAIGRSALARGTPPATEGPADPGAPELVAPLLAPPPMKSQPPVGAAAEAPPTAGPPVPSVAPVPDAGAGEGAPRARATPDDPVVLNQATLADLRRLPGVGAKRAQAILALRDKLQRFRQVEDLLKVKGIGRASLKKLRPLVRLDALAAPVEAGVATTPPPSPG